MKKIIGIILFLVSFRSTVGTPCTELGKIYIIVSSTVFFLYIESGSFFFTTDKVRGKEEYINIGVGDVRLKVQTGGSKSLSHTGWSC